MQENQSTQTPSLVAWILLILLSITWGTSFFFVKKITHEFTGIELGAGRIFVAGFSLLPIAIYHLKNLKFEKVPALLTSGLLGYLIPAVLFGIVGSKIESSLSGTLNATTPIFVLLIGSWFFGKIISRNQYWGIFLGFIGSLILVLSGSDNFLKFDNPYALLVVLATVMYGFNANILGSKLRDVPPMVISAFSLLFVGFISFLILLNTDFFQKILLVENREYLYSFLFLGVVNSGIASYLYNYTLQISSPIFASSVTYLIPIVATIVGIFIHENIGFYHYLGMGIVLVGVYILNKK
ncbi:MAG: DMT family transporter [Leadbetterella sp.]